MFPKGTIYKQGEDIKGEKVISLPLRSRIIYHLISKSGAGIAAFMIVSFLTAFWPILKEELIYDLGFKKQAVIEESRDYGADIAEAERIIQTQKEAEEWGVNSYFSLVIPKIEAASNVVANVDASVKSEYVEALKRGVAHAKGTYFPGQGKTIFLFSHSTDSPLNIARYNAVFYLLRKLDKGDRVIIFFADQKYEYEVTDKVFAEPSDTSWLTYQSDEEKLILMTCDPPGTTWRRLIILARRI